MKLRCIIAIVLALGFAPFLSAQEYPDCPSIDSTVDGANRVVVAHVVEVGEAHLDKYGLPRSSVVFDVEQTIKGTAQKRLTLDAKTKYQSEYVHSGYPAPQDFQNWQRHGTKLMVIVSDEQNGDHAARIISFDGPNLKGVTADFAVLTTPAQFIQAATEEVRRTSGAVKRDLAALLPMHPQLKGTGFEGCLIYVPIDDRLLKTEEGRKELADLAQDDRDPDQRAAAKLVLKREHPPRVHAPPLHATYDYGDNNGGSGSFNFDYDKEQVGGLGMIPRPVSHTFPASPEPFRMNVEIPKLPQEPARFEPDFPHPGPIADANPAIRHHVTLMVPTKFKIARDAKTLSVGLDPASMRPVGITVGKKMVIGEREEDRIYEAGQTRPVKSGGISLSGLTEDNNEASIDTGATRFYNFSQDHIPAPGKTYIVEMKFTVFETKTPPQHMWRPEMDKILWTGTLKTTVGQ